MKTEELFSKHEQTKIECLSEFNTINNEFTELNQEFIQLSEHIDGMIEHYVKENSVKRMSVLNKIKSISIDKYKKYMDYYVIYIYLLIFKISVLIFVKKVKDVYLNPEKFHTCHIIATEKCLIEFERLTQNDIELNSEIKWVETELRNVHSSYLILNQNNLKNNLTLKDKLNLILNPGDFMNQKLADNFSEQLKFVKQNIKNSLYNPLELFKSTILVFSLVFYLILSYVIVFFDLLANINLKYSSILTYMCLFYKYFLFYF